MAEVFLALVRGAAVTKLVVLKRIWPELATDATFAEMFLHEARLSVRMSHPNVVQTYDVIHHAGRLAMAMEYLEGQPLTRVLNRLYTSGAIVNLTLAQRLRIVIDILAGLDHVHELTDYDGKPLGVVHRDVSPHNVFITYDGHIKLMDFGVAKTIAASHLTRPGTIKGKLAYMSPDQLRGAPLDRRTDIFSAGVILWEMLSGRRMWPGKSEVSIVRHLSYGLPLPTLREDLHLPAGLLEVCNKALALNRDDRFATAAEMEGALRALLPAVADSYARNLGKIVSLAFAAERAERQALIDHHLLNVLAIENAGDAALAGIPDLGDAAGDAMIDTPIGAGASHGTVATSRYDLAVERESPPPEKLAAHRRRRGPMPAAAVLAAVATVMVTAVVSLPRGRISDWWNNHKAAPIVIAGRPVAGSIPRLVALRPDGESAAVPPALTFPAPAATEGQTAVEQQSAPAGEPTPDTAPSPTPEPSETADQPDTSSSELAAVSEPLRAKRTAKKRLAWRDEFERPDTSRRRSRHETSGAANDDTFSTEVGDTRPPARQRAIDTVSPFLP